MKNTLRTLGVASVISLTAIALSGCTAAPGSAAGTWGEPDANEQPWLTFEDDGTFSGNDGCNGLGGNWTLGEDDKATIDLGQMRSTLMYCEGVDTWLSLAATARLGNDVLTLIDADGNEIGELARAAD